MWTGEERKPSPEKFKLGSLLVSHASWQLAVFFPTGAHRACSLLCIISRPRSSAFKSEWVRDCQSGRTRRCRPTSPEGPDENMRCDRHLRNGAGILSYPRRTHQQRTSTGCVTSIARRVLAPPSPAVLPRAVPPRPSRSSSTFSRPSSSPRPSFCQSAAGPETSLVDDQQRRSPLRHHAADLGAGVGALVYAARALVRPVVRGCVPTVPVSVT